MDRETHVCFKNGLAQLEVKFELVGDELSVKFLHPKTHKECNCIIDVFSGWDELNDYYADEWSDLVYFMINEINNNGEINLKTFRKYETISQIVFDKGGM